MGKPRQWFLFVSPLPGREEENWGWHLFSWRVSIKESVIDTWPLRHPATNYFCTFSLLTRGFISYRDLLQSNAEHALLDLSGILDSGISFVLYKFDFSLLPGSHSSLNRKICAVSGDSCWYKAFSWACRGFPGADRIISQPLWLPSHTSPSFWDGPLPAVLPHPDLVLQPDTVLIPMSCRFLQAASAPSALSLDLPGVCCTLGKG